MSAAQLQRSQHGNLVAATTSFVGRDRNANNGMRALANGATLGGADRLAAGAGALTGIGGTQGDYAGNLAAQRAQTDAFQQEHPVISGAANVAG
ncbi:MAG: hypothetical protein ACXWP4_28905, partial [Polyangiales bacterium]